MGLSKRHLDTQNETLPVHFDTLAQALKEGLPEALFAYLLGSAASSGTVAPRSDLDIALFLAPDKPADLSLYSRAQDACDRSVGPLRCDLGILNRAEPVYRFEALKGRLLFCRDRETWLRFYSRTCREYEHQLFHYEKQRRYRLESSR